MSYSTAMSGDKTSCWSSQFAISGRLAIRSTTEWVYPLGQLKDAVEHAARGGNGGAVVSGTSRRLRGGRVGSPEAFYLDRTTCIA